MQNTIMRATFRVNFVAFLKANPELTGKPINTRFRSAMQYFDADGVIQAQAIYEDGSASYLIRQQASEPIHA